MSEAEKAALRIQSVFRSWKAIKKWKARVRMHVHRTYVANEIFKTEKHYVNSLRVFLEVFYYPLCKRKVVEQGVLETIFGNISRIYDIHVDLLADITQRLDDWSYDQTLGDVFNKYWKTMQCYEEYVNNYDASTAACKKEIKSNKEFEEFLEIAEKNPRCKKLDFFDFSIQPIQRVPRYAMLVSELLKNTTSMNKDSEYLVKAKTSVNIILKYFNESKRMLQQRETSIRKVRELKRSVSGAQDFLKPDKDFLFEGPLAIQKSKKKTEQVYVFLFRDSLLVARALGVTNGFLKRMSGYKFSALQNIKLQKYSLVEHSVPTGIKLRGKKKKHKDIELYAETVAIKEKWIEVLNTRLHMTMQMKHLEQTISDM